MQTLETSYVSSSATSSACPTGYIFNIEMRDGTSLDTELFTLDQSVNALVTNSSDYLKIKTYEMRLTVAYNEVGYTNFGFLDFEVIVDDPCSIAVLSVDPNIVPISSISYGIGNESITETFEVSMLSSTE